jgi:hypothetical protein
MQETEKAPGLSANSLDCLRGPIAKFMDSPYYSESEICEGAVTVSFEVHPLASDALLTTLHPLLENGVTVILKEPFSGW